LLTHLLNVFCSVTTRSLTLLNHSPQRPDEKILFVCQNWASRIRFKPRSLIPGCCGMVYFLLSPLNSLYSSRASL